MVIHQVEFLLEGYLMPPTIGRLQVSETLILEQVVRSGQGITFYDDQKSFTKAYVGVVTLKEASPFLIARDYLEFFLLIYSLVSGQPVTARMGVGTTLDDMTSLGAKRIGFPSFEEIHVLGDHKDSLFSKPILGAKERFLQLLPDRQRIMENPLGLALTYYYLAVRASRRRLEEAVIHLIIAGEALLCVETKGTSKNLPRRLSTLIAENEAEKAKISKEMRRLYKLRCGIVHGGRKKPSLIDVRILFNYVRRAIDRGLFWRHLLKKELVAKLDKGNIVLTNPRAQDS